jgi:hypothetical protein
VGRSVSSSRATPTNPITAPGTCACAASAMPSPARSTGTSTGGRASTAPVVEATGVAISVGLVGASRMAS